MIDEEKVELAVEEFLKNLYWKQDYDECPTEQSRRVTALGFFRSWACRNAIATPEELDEAQAEMDELRRHFGLEDWKHELKYCGHNPYHAICAQKVKELSGEQ